MSYSIENLRAMSDDEIVRLHDESAINTVVGVNYFLDELERRSRERATAAANQLARRGFWLGVVSTITSLGAFAAAIIAIFIH